MVHLFCFLYFVFREQLSQSVLLARCPSHFNAIQCLLHGRTTLHFGLVGFKFYIIITIGSDANDCHDGIRW